MQSVLGTGDASPVYTVTLETRLGLCMGVFSGVGVRPRFKSEKTDEEKRKGGDLQA